MRISRKQVGQVASASNDVGRDCAGVSYCAQLAINPLAAFSVVVLLGSIWVAPAVATELNVPSASYPTIQSAIDAAATDDVIIVAEGTYYENINFGGKQITVRSTNPNDPAVVANTVIDGGGAGSVVTFAGTESPETLLSGLTITNGSAEYGAGICGGQADADHTQAAISNCRVIGNSAQAYGGGLFQCDGKITNCLVQNNEALRSWSPCGGGGLARCHGLIRDCTIADNKGGRNGGGLYECDGEVRRCLIRDNTAFPPDSQAGRGGGLSHCKGLVATCVIAGNRVRENGGGLYECEGPITDCLIVANLSWEDSGGLSHCRSVTNCTIIRNMSYASACDEGLRSCQSVANCIIWGNSDPEVSWTEPSYSCVQNWSGGRQNIDGDPMFVDPDGPDGYPSTWEDNDYRLQAGSPCINSGNFAYRTAVPGGDNDGNCRVIGGQVDMGCYEYGSSLDSDGDWLRDTDESAYATDPVDSDTDDDNLLDGIELLAGKDPCVADPLGDWHVPSPISSVRRAILFARQGERVILAPGTYYENINFDGKLVTLQSSDPDDWDVVETTIIDGGGFDVVVRFDGTESSDAVLTGLMLTNGRGGLAGYNYWSRNYTGATITNCAIVGNSGTGLSGCSGIIGNCLVCNNSAASYGHGGGFVSCGGVIQNCVIVQNHADCGGGLALCGASISNSVIAENSASVGAGAMWCVNGAISNCTIVGNSAESAPGGLGACEGSVANCIIWGNSNPQVSWTEPSYSCVQDWAGGGEGNIVTDPLFVDADGPDDDPATWQDNDYHLLPNSPCINGGDPGGDYSGQLDMDGEPRVLYGRVDMGADEVTPIAGDFEPDGDVDLDDYAVIESAMNGPNQPPGDPAADLDADGDCDLNDLSIFVLSFTGPL